MASYIENRRIDRPFMQIWNQLIWTLFNLLLLAGAIAWVAAIANGQRSETPKHLLQIIFITILSVLGIGGVPGFIDNIIILCAYEIHDEVVLLGGLDKLRVYIEEGGDPNVVSNNGLGDSLLYLAIHVGNQAMIQLLLEYGVKKDIFSAVALGEIDEVHSYLNAGEPVDVTDSDRRTLLHIAIEHSTGHELVGLLISSGSNVNICEISIGDSPLHTAVRNELPLSTVKALIDAGADLTIKNNNNRTPLDIAKLEEMDYVIDYLENIESGAI